MLDIIFDSLGGWLVDFANLMFEAIMSTDFETALRSGADPQSLNSVIPYFSGFISILNVVGWIVLVMLAYSALIRIIAGPFTGSEEDPLKTVLKIALAAVLLRYRKEIFTLLLNYSDIYVFQRMKNLVSGVETVKLNWSWSGWHFINKFARFALVGSIAFAEAQAAITYVERFLSFCLYLYTFPIAAAFIVSPRTMESFRQWLVGVLTQVLMLASTYAMIFMAMSSLNTSFTGYDGTLNVLGLAVSLALFTLAKNLEKILSMYNIRTMPTADAARSFLGGIVTAAALAGSAVRMTGSAVRTGIAAGSDLRTLRANAASASSGTSLSAEARASVRGMSRKEGMSTLGARGESLRNASHSDPKNPLKVVPDSMSSERVVSRAAREDGIARTGREAGIRSMSGTMLNSSLSRSDQKRYAEGYQNAWQERSAAQSRYNAWVDSRGKSGSLSSEDVSKALHLDQAIPNFAVSRGNAQYIRGKDGGDAVMISGLERRTDGTSVPKTYAIGTEELMQSAKHETVGTDRHGNERHQVSYQIGNDTEHEAFTFAETSAHAPVMKEVSDSLYAYEVHPTRFDADDPYKSFGETLNEGSSEQAEREMKTFGYGSEFSFEEHDVSGAEPPAPEHSDAPKEQAEWNEEKRVRQKKEEHDAIEARLDESEASLDQPEEAVEEEFVDPDSFSMEEDADADDLNDRIDSSEQTSAAEDPKEDQPHGNA